MACIPAFLSWKILLFGVQFLLGRAGMKNGHPGGAYNQKSMGCLSFGSILNNGDKLVFEMDSLKYAGFPDPCENIMLLPGCTILPTYIDGDSIVFEKNSGDKKIVYYLKNTALDSGITKNDKSIR